MTEHKSGEHPDLLQLSNYAEGDRKEPEAGMIREHLDGCVLCRLELKQIARFNTIEMDKELLQKAEWERAKSQLGKFREEKFGAVALDDRSKKKTPRFGPLQLRHLVPAAMVAAAATILIVVNTGRGPSAPLFSPSDNVLRGEDSAGYEITLEGPHGDIRTLPAEFIWSDAGSFSSYTLEIFRPDLTVVFRQEEILESRFDISPSLQNFLLPGEEYIWRVLGYRDFEAAIISRNLAFRISTE